MKQLLKPGLMPRAKVGDFENALALLVATGADKSTKAYLTQLKVARCSARRGASVRRHYARTARTAATTRCTGGRTHEMGIAALAEAHP